MKAVRIYEYGGPDKLTFEENVPDPVMQPGSILIEAAAASVNPIDWKVRSGARQKDVPLSLPAILGRDVSGVVCSVATDVPNFRVGDRVLALTHATYAELVLVEHSIVTHLPDGVDLIDAAAIPLIALTGDQLVRYAAAARAGQTILVTGAMGSVGRAAVHAARKLGARVIAGVRSRQTEAARSLGAADVVAIDDDQAIAKLPPVDAVADTVGGETGAKLFAKVRNGGNFGYASVIPVGTAEMNPTVKLTRVFARPDASKVREFADDLRDGSFILPIGLRLPLREAAQAHVLGERGGIGKILLLANSG
jgi:NADPH:quinone reductase-like Zn-dependent oxidoreductase